MRKIRNVGILLLSIMLLFTGCSMTDDTSSVNAEEKTAEDNTNDAEGKYNTCGSVILLHTSAGVFAIDMNLNTVLLLYSDYPYGTTGFQIISDKTGAFVTADEFSAEYGYDLSKIRVDKTDYKVESRADGKYYLVTPGSGLKSLGDQYILDMSLNAVYVSLTPDSTRLGSCYFQLMKNPSIPFTAEEFIKLYDIDL